MRSWSRASRATSTVLSDGCGLHKGAKASTRIYDGERVWHLTFCVRERHELVSARRARIALTLNDRELLGEERRLPRVAVPGWRPPHGARAIPAASAWASVLDVSQGGLALRAAVLYGAGDLIDIDLDDGTGAVISARIEVVDLVADRPAESRAPASSPSRRTALSASSASSTGCATRPATASRRPSRCPRCARRWPPLAAPRPRTLHSNHGPRYAQRGGAELRHVRGVARSRDHRGRLRPARGARARPRGDPHAISRGARRATAAARASASSRTTSRSSAACATASRWAARSR